MKISFYNSEDDYIKYINSVSFVFQKILSIIFILVLFFNCAATVFKILTTFRFKLIFTVLLVGIYLVGFLLFKLISKPLFGLINKIFIGRDLKKLLNSHPNMIGEKVIKLGEDKLLVSANNETIECNYSKVSIIVWRQNFIDIAYNKKLLCVIPDNVFDSKENKWEFVRLAKEKTRK